jgi:hypothetical protein
MAFTEYKFDKEMLKALVAERAANLRANRGFSNLLRSVFLAWKFVQMTTYSTLLV